MAMTIEPIKIIEDIADVGCRAARGHLQWAIRHGLRFRCSITEDPPSVMLRLRNDDTRKEIVALWLDDDGAYRMKYSYSVTRRDGTLFCVLTPISGNALRKELA